MTDPKGCKYELLSNHNLTFACSILLGSARKGDNIEEGKESNNGDKLKQQDEPNNEKRKKKHRVGMCTGIIDWRLCLQLTETHTHLFFFFFFLKVILE